MVVVDDGKFYDDDADNDNDDEGDEGDDDDDEDDEDADDDDDDDEDDGVESTLLTHLAEVGRGVFGLRASSRTTCESIQLFYFSSKIFKCFHHMCVQL